MAEISRVNHPPDPPRSRIPVNKRQQLFLPRFSTQQPNQMKTNQPQKLQSYLIGLGGVTLLASTSNAAVVTMDISPLSGLNAGLAPGTQKSVPLSSLDAGLTGDFNIYNVPATPSVGLTGSKGSVTYIAKIGTIPKRFASGTTIDSSSAFTVDSTTLFSNGSSAWEAGSYLGFKSSGGNYGWLETTWDPTITTFEVLAGAYESVAGAAITAGAIPEPGTLALLVAGAGAVVALRRRKTATPA